MNTRPTKSDGAALLELLGQECRSAAVQSALAGIARGMQPELPTEDDFVDWVTVNELGLEFGFITKSHLQATDEDAPGAQDLVLAQLYFYGETPRTRAFPWALPFGLSFGDDAGAVRRKMGAHEASRRSYIRDAWDLPDFSVTVGYRGDDGLIESIYCHLRFAPWPPVHANAARLAPFTPDVFAQLFGLRWSSPRLRERLGPLGYDGTLANVRGAHMADLGREHGITLTFAPGRTVGTPVAEAPDSPALAGVTYHASRDEDATEWQGPLPEGLNFSNSQAVLVEKLGAPDQRQDGDRTGMAVWQRRDYVLSVVYSNIENRVLRVSLFAPTFWRATRG